MNTTCYYDDDGCLVCPEQAYAPFVPSRIDVRADFGWDAGANSIDVHAGDIETTFTMPATFSTLIGWRTGAPTEFLSSSVEHGLLFTQQGGVHYVQPVDHGRTVGARTVRALGDSFSLQRRHTLVSVKRGATTLLAMYPTRSVGAKRVVAALYRTGDVAPVNAQVVGGAPIRPAVSVPATLVSSTLSGATVTFTPPNTADFQGAALYRFWLPAPYVLVSEGFPPGMSYTIDGAGGGITRDDTIENEDTAFAFGVLTGQGLKTCVFTYLDAPVAADTTYAPTHVLLVPVDEFVVG